MVKNFKDDTLFCFTMKQSRFIAKRLAHSKFQDSAVVALNTKEMQWIKLLKIKDTTILRLETKIKNLFGVHLNDKVHLQTLHAKLKIQRQQLRSSRLERWFLGGGLLVLTGVLLAQ